MTDSSHLAYTGVEYYFLRRFETDCHVHVIDLDLARMKIFAGFSAVPTRAIQQGAQIAHNANGWGLWVNQSLSNEFLVIEGVSVQKNAIDFRPCMNVTKDGKIEFWTKYPIGAYNVIGFDRLIAVDGVYNTKITNTASDPRTVYGCDASGCLVILVCEGRRGGQKGLTFPEIWSVMQEFGVTDCGNADGGYSSCFYDLHFGGLLNQSYEVEFRSTVCQVLFFANELGEVPQSEGENMEYQMTTNEPTNIRVDHNTAAAKVSGTVSNPIPAGVVLKGAELFTATQQLSNTAGVYQMVGDKWLKTSYGSYVGWVALIHKGQAICKDFKEVSDIPVPPPVVDPPTDTDRLLLVLEFVNGTWTNGRYFQVKEVDGS